MKINMKMNMVMMNLKAKNLQKLNKFIKKYND